MYYSFQDLVTAKQKTNKKVNQVNPKQREFDRKLKEQANTAGS